MQNLAHKTPLEILQNLENDDIDYTDIETEQKIIITNPALIATKINHIENIKPPAKDRINARIDSDVLNWFRSQGKGYQTHINAVLRAYYLNNKSNKN